MFMTEKSFSDGDDELESILPSSIWGARRGRGPVLVSESQVCALSWRLCFRVTVRICRGDSRDVEEHIYIFLLLPKDLTSVLGKNCYKGEASASDWQARLRY